MRFEGGRELWWWVVVVYFMIVWVRFFDLASGGGCGVYAVMPAAV